MTLTESREQNEMIMDGLREIGTIGAAHASTALSELVHKDIMIEVSDCFVCRTQELPTAFSTTEETVVAVFLEALGRSRGGIMLVVSQKMAIELTDLVLAGARREPLPDEMDQMPYVRSATSVPAYLNAYPSPITMMPHPGVAVDMLRPSQFPPPWSRRTPTPPDKDHVQVRKNVGFGFYVYISDRDSSCLIEKFG